MSEWSDRHTPLQQGGGPQSSTDRATEGTQRAAPGTSGGQGTGQGIEVRVIHGPLPLVAGDSARGTVPGGHLCWHLSRGTTFPQNGEAASGQRTRTLSGRVDSRPRPSVREGQPLRNRAADSSDCRRQAQTHHPTSGLRRPFPQTPRSDTLSCGYHTLSLSS
jgi:hypothetical protein